MIKLLIVDDSALVRKLLTGIFNAHSDFEVRQARDGIEALGMLGEYAPDVITLDVNMPRMDGLTCLDRIMIEHPCPVVMVSALTADEAMIIRFGRELLEQPRVSDDTFDAVRARWGERGLMELTAVMSVFIKSYRRAMRPNIAAT